MTREEEEENLYEVASLARALLLRRPELGAGVAWRLADGHHDELRARLQNLITGLEPAGVSQ